MNHSAFQPFCSEHLPPLPQTFTVDTRTRKRTSATAALLIAALILSPISALAEPTPSYPYTLTGERFVRMMSGAEPLDSYDYMLREKAYSYLDGVRDSAEGRDWCDLNELKTPDLAYELAAEIAKAPAAERKTNASILLLKLLHRRYPCPAKGVKP